jgi:hypothetical protein
MKLDLQSLFGLHLHSCTHRLGPRTPPPPCIWVQIRGRYWSAKIDDISDPLLYIQPRVILTVY